MLNDDKSNDKPMCDGSTEVYSRVTGFYRPIQQWNKGKKSEYTDRKPYDTEDLLYDHPKP